MSGSVGAWTTLILPCELLAVRWTPLVHWVEVTVKRATSIFPCVLLTVRRTLSVQWVIVTVRGTTRVLPCIFLAVRRAVLIEGVVFAVTVDKLWLAATLVHLRSLLITFQRWTKDFRTLTKGLSCSLIVGIWLSKCVIPLLKWFLWTLIVAAPLTDLDLTGGVDIKHVGELECREESISHNIGPTLIVGHPFGEKTLQQFVLHHTAKFVCQLKPHCVAVLVVFA